MAKDGEVARSFQPLLGLSRSFSGGSWEPHGRSHDRGRRKYWAFFETKTKQAATGVGREHIVSQ
jgi:hypothetical protein